MQRNETSHSQNKKGGEVGRYYGRIGYTEAYYLITRQIVSQVKIEYRRYIN